MRDPTGRGRRVSAEERVSAVQQELAAELIGSLCALDQAGRLYDLNNEMVRKVAEEILGIVQRFVKATGEEMCLTVVGFTVFVNRRLVRLGFNEYRRAQQLRMLWEHLGVGGIRFPLRLTHEGLMEFIAVLFGALNDPHKRPALFNRQPGQIQLEPSQGDDLPGERRNPHEFTIRVYCALLALTERTLDRLRLGKRPPVLRIKRAMQAAVDLLEGQEYLLVALTRSPVMRNRLEGHLVGTAILALAVGRRLELGRVELMALGTATLFHDLAKAGLKDEALNSLEHPEALQPKDRQRVEGLWLKVARRVVEVGGFSDEMLARLVVMYESQLEFARRDLYPALGQERHNLYSRIAAVCDLYDTLAWVRPGKTQRTAHYAMLALLQSAATGAHPQIDPILAATLLEVIGLYPVGSPVLLNTGEVGVVTQKGESSFADPERPVVHLVFDAQGNPADGPELDLAQDPTRRVLWPLTAAPLGINPAACFEKSGAIQHGVY